MSLSKSLAFTDPWDSMIIRSIQGSEDIIAGNGWFSYNHGAKVSCSLFDTVVEVVS